MSAQRAEIGKGAWMEQRDNLFIYTDAPRILGFVWARRVVVARSEKVEVVRRSSFRCCVKSIVYRFVLTSNAVLWILLLPGLMQWPNWPSLSIHFVEFCLVAGMLAVLAGFAYRKTRIRVYGLPYAPYSSREFTFAHGAGTTPQLDGLLDELVRRRDPASSLLPFPLRLDLPRIWLQRAIFVFILMSFPWVGLISTEYKNPDLWFLYSLMPFGLLLGSALLVALSVPKPVREARAALLAGDTDAAAVLLDAFLERNPTHAFANYLSMILALLKGDLCSAGRFACSVRCSSPFFWFWFERGAVARALWQLDDPTGARRDLTKWETPLTPSDFTETSP